MLARSATTRSSFEIPMSVQLMKPLTFLRKIKKRFTRYHPSVEVSISKTRLVGNLNEYKKKYPELSFAPVLKSNAYGHGLAPVAQILDKEDVAFFALDSLYEAMVLRNNGVKSKILIIGYTSSENIINSKLSRIAFVITGLEQLQEVAKKIASRVEIHLKIDTGMHRQGILPSQIEDAITIIKNNKFLNLEGVASHFADADNNDETFTKVQIEKWESAVSLFQKNFQTIRFLHISATAGISHCGQIHGNVVRLGIGLYGVNTSPAVTLDVRPVLHMQAIVSSLKNLPAGEHIGYNSTYTVTQNSTIATVPVGYFEGVDRRLSNGGFFKIGDHNCSIVGRVSMNITSIDVTSVPNIKLGDCVTIISSNRDDKNSVEKIAEFVHTIPGEILVHIPESIHRTVIED